MPTRNVDLTEDQDSFVELQQRRKEDELNLTALHKQIKAGADALDHGNFTEIDGADLDNALDNLATN